MSARANTIGKWPIAGYAPGNYHCKCADCEATFEGDKRAIQCLPCALTSSGYRILGPDEIAAGGHLCGLPHYGEYTGQVILAAPTFLKRKWPDGIGIDVCLSLEIQNLWRNGVETSGHCCGHGMSEPFISVWPSSVEKMRALGYEQLPHPDPVRNDHFKAKTAIRALCATHQGDK